MQAVWPGDDSLDATDPRCPDDNDSLSYLLSSPDRYAQIMGLTVQEVQAVKELREGAKFELQRNLQSATNDDTRHRLVAEHRFRYGKHPFVCPKCWSYRPICLCPAASRKKLRIPFKQIIIWTHPGEWGSPSNTGSILPLLLNNTHIWMKGYHDSLLNQVLSDRDCIPMILWPDPASTKQIYTNSSFWFWSADEDSPLPNVIGGIHNVTLIVMEGTWRQARRMVGSLGVSFGLALHSPITPSRLAPLRKHKTKTLCTAEAVVAACEAVQTIQHDNDFNGDEVLAFVDLKVDLTRRYQGKARR